MICALQLEPAAGTAFVRGDNHSVFWSAYQSAAVAARRHCPVAAHSSVARTSLIGIDLGTSNSTIACLQDGSAVIVPAADGGRFTPSVVALSKDGTEPLVGQDAVEASRSSGNFEAYRAVKRLIGRRHSEVLKLLRDPPPELSATKRGEAALWSTHRQGLVSPEEISAILVKHLVQQAVHFLGQQIEGAVITVPADFRDAQRQAIRRAAEMAGLENVQLLQEPIAAALACGAGSAQADENVLVFDLGGGTLDVSLLDSFEGALEVLDIDGDGHLGGNDFDEALANWLLPRHMLNEHATRMRADSPSWTRFLGQAEAAKVGLSRAPAVAIDLGGLQVPSQQVQLTQEDLEEATWGLRKRLWAPLARMGLRSCIHWHLCPPPGADTDRSECIRPEAPKRHIPGTHAVRDYSPPPRRVTRLVMVGGSSRIPWVRQFVAAATGVQPSSDVDPEECVALGAAIYAGMLSGHIAGIELADGAYALDLHGRSSGFPLA